MVIRNGVIALLLLTGIPLGVWGWSEPGERYQVRVKVLEGTDKPRQYVDSAIMAAEDGSIRMVSGGECPADDPADVRRFGLEINGSLRDRGKRLSLKIDFSSRVPSDDGTATVIHGQYVDLQTTVVPGVKRRLHYGGDRWCEVMVERISPGIPLFNKSE